MKRGPRDQDAAQSRKWARRSPNQRRAPSRPQRSIHGIYSESSVAISDEQRASAPTLSELRQRQKHRWLWDRAPAGCASLNAAALKLFGAAPGASINERTLPDEIKRLRRPAALDPEHSWIYRLAGGQIHATNALAARAVANGSERPANLLDSRSSLFTDKRAIIARNVSDLQAVEGFYGTLAAHSELDPQTHVVLPQSEPERLRNEDAYLFRHEKTAPTIEVLNAVSMAKPTADVEAAIRALCDSVGEPVKRVWRASNTNYALPRVFIEPANPENAEQMARKLGQRKLQGRPLVTALNYAHALTN